MAAILALYDQLHLGSGGTGRPARIDRVPYSGGKPLYDIRMTLAELQCDAERLRGCGWLRVTVPLDAPDFELNRKVRQLLGGAAVSVDYELPEHEDTVPQQSRSGLSSGDLFALYHRRQHRSAPEAPLMAAFNNLLGEALEAPE